MNDRSWAGFLAAACLFVACSGPEEPPPVPESTVVVGSFDFTEGAILSHLYAGVLDYAGFEVKVESVATREIMEPALEQGHIDVVPEYRGTLLRFLRPLADLESEGNPREVLDETLEARGLAALEAAPGQNQNVLVVTSQTASDHDLTKIGDLQKVAGEMVFGGPPECPARPLCLLGLEGVYGLEFGRFIPLDAGGPLTLAALNGGEIDVGLLFGTDPAIDRDGLTVLIDDQGLQPAENILPVVRAEVLEEGGSAFSDSLNELSTHLTTETLRQLNSSVDDEGRAPEDVAEQWLETEGLV